MRSAGANLFIIALAFVGAGLEVAAGDAPPASVDLRTRLIQFGMQPKAQLSRNTCSLFAITALAEFELSKASHPLRLSEEYLVWAADSSTGRHGDQAMFYEAIHGLQTSGICIDRLSPYRAVGAPDLVPSRKAQEDAEARKPWVPTWIKRWNAGTGLSDAQQIALKREIAAEHLVAVGLRWPSRLQLDKNSLVQADPSTQVFDGHSVTFIGYRDDAALPGGGAWLFRNCAGRRFADAGYAWLTYEYVNTFTNDAVSLRWVPSLPPPATLEAEALPVTNMRDCNPSEQGMQPYGEGMWGQGRQLFIRGKMGAHLELGFDVVEARRYDVSVRATCAPDFANIAFSLDEAMETTQFDSYAPRVYPSGELSLGSFDLSSGRHTLKLNLVGKNAASQGMNAGIDAVLLRPSTSKSPSPISP